MKRVVTMGGGTGTFVVLSGLRRQADIALTAIVTEADDGGSTGHLRDAYGFLPPGDARQALVALAEDGNVLRDLFAYRFEKGDVAGHSLGNLFLTALEDMLGSGTKALEEASRILRIHGRVIPATQKPAVLSAKLSSGEVLVGQNRISTSRDDGSTIAELSLTEPLPLTDAARDAVLAADRIILGPGCLYSSTVAALLAGDTKEALKESKAELVYVMNLFTKAGETEGYTASAHVREVERYAGRRIDRIFMHEGTFSPEVLEWYAKEEEYPIEDDLGGDSRVTRLPLASVDVVVPREGDPLRRSLIRHDSERLAAALV
jgi:uncharacterized cofD-like protein